MTNPHQVARAAFRRLALAAVALSACSVAMAQSNSLMRGPASQAPTSQPAGGMSPAAPFAPLPPPGIGVDAPPKNRVLLALSPIASPPPEPRKIKVHDLVTIIVREDKRSVSDAKLKSEKKWELDSELKKWFRLNPEDHLVAQQFNPTPGAEFDFENKYNGTGKVDRTDSLTMRIQAEVIDVKPNGNLVLEANKKIENDEEVQVMTLTGACRSEDVTPQNTVLSSQVADLHVRTEHAGAARDAARRGWLMRIFDFVRPF